MSKGRARRILRALAGVAAIACAAPAAAQDAGPGRRQALAELAHVLGQSHAVRQACEGPSDQLWRGWMIRLIEAEKVDPDLDRLLRDGFNAGYYGAQGRFAECDDEARAEAARLAARGKGLTRRARGG